MSAEYHALTYTDVALAAGVILVNAAVSLALRLGLERRLLIAALRTVGQLVLVGYVLHWIFRQDDWRVIVPLMAWMTAIAGWAASQRVERRYRGVWADSSLAVLVSSWAVTWFALLVIFRPATWVDRPAQVVVPLLGLVLGNTLNGISLGLDRLAEAFATRRDEIELRLTLGATRWEAARDAVRQAIRAGMTPIINSMMVVGLVSLPGIMTGLMLADVEPLDAVRYQIVIMFLLAAATALATTTATLLGYRRLFNSRHQFLAARLGRLPKRPG
jgi:putative ABC transport system permease protein